MRLKGLSPISLLAATAMLGCNDSDDSDASGADDLGSVFVDAGDLGTSRPDSGNAPGDGGQEMDAGMTCTLDPNEDLTRDPSCPMTASYFRFVQGQALANGTGVAEARPQICVVANDGRDACLEPGSSCADGAWLQEIRNTDFRCLSSIVMRLSKVTGGSFAVTYCDIQLAGEGVLTLASPLNLYPVDPASNLPPYGDGSQPRPVNLQDNVRIEVTPEDLELCFPGDTSCADYDKLGVRKLGASDPTPCFVDSANVPDAIYAFSVDMDVAGQGFPIRLPNDENLTAGTVVDLFVQGALFCTRPDGTPIEEGEWAQYGTATVSSDGMFIEGGRIPCLNWFGYKAR